MLIEHSYESSFRKSQITFLVNEGTKKRQFVTSKLLVTKKNTCWNVPKMIKSNCIYFLQ